MTPTELLSKLVSYTGPCFRICSYCPEEFKTKEVKECVENLIRENYQLQQDKVQLMVVLLNIMDAYKLKTGEEYKIGENENENI